jgi:hypothetical protein
MYVHIFPVSDLDGIVRKVDGYASPLTQYNGPTN